MRRWVYRMVSWASALCLVGAVVLAAVAPMTYVRAAEWLGIKEHMKPETAEEVRFGRARRGPLVISLIETGTLQAVQNHVIRPTLQQGAKITWVVAEGATVKKGDKVVEFERQPILDQIRNQEDSLASSKHSLDMETKSIEIETAAGVSRMAEARASLDKANDDLKRYREVEATARAKDLVTGLITARKKYDEAKDALRQALRTAEEEMSPTEERQKANEAAISKARVDLLLADKAARTADAQLKAFRMTEYVRTLDARKLAKDNAELALKKTDVDVQKRMEQIKLNIRRYESQVKNTETRLAQLKKDLDMCTLTAPVDGTVYYGDPQQYGWRQPLELGTMVWQGQALMYVPDTSAFQIKMDIPEEYRRKISDGCAAKVRIEAIGDRDFEGKVKRVTQKLGGRGGEGGFEGTIELQKQGDGMATGLRARVEIVAETLPDVLQVPIEAVFSITGRKYCFMRDTAAYRSVEVETGKSNDSFVEILSGLKEGDEVYLVDPRSLQEKTAAEEQEKKAAEKAQPPNKPAPPPAPPAKL